MNELIQERLRTLREETGYSQEKLASLFGITRMTLAGYELGKRPPDSEYILKVAAFFDCTPDYIFGISPFKNNQHYKDWVSSTDVLTTELSRLPDEKKKELVATLNWLLQDNSGVNQFTTDKDYLVDKFINLILPFTNIFQELSKTLENSNLELGVDEADIFQFYKAMEKEKTELNTTISSACDDAFTFLMARARREDIARIAKKE